MKLMLSVRSVAIANKVIHVMTSVISLDWENLVIESINRCIQNRANGSAAAARTI